MKNEQINPWLKATIQDFEQVDWEEPIFDSDSADCHDLNTAYRLAREKVEMGTEEERPDGRVFSMLEAICSMHFRVDQPNEPFTAMMTFADGRRTAAAEDFVVKKDVIRELGSTARNVVLRARLSDLSWTLDRRSGASALDAISAYDGVVDGVDKGTLKLRFDQHTKVFSPQIRDILKRALQIGRRIGWEKETVVKCRNRAINIQERAFISEGAIAISWFAGLDVEMRLSDPSLIAEKIETFVNKESEQDWNIAIDLYRTAARAYQSARKEDEKNRCLLGIANRLVKQARASQQALLASHFMSDAISH